MVSRFGFSLIELIFAIVIIGITVLSLPMMNQVTSNTIENNLVQEAIFAAAVTVNQTTSYNWDENSNLDNNLSRVISSGDCNTTTKKRLGHIMRRCLNDTTITSSAIGSDINETLSDDIDDRDTANVFSSIFDTANNSFSTEADGYKDDYQSSIRVTYSTFGEAGINVSANMKKVTVSIQDSSGDTITELSAYSANIGEVEPDSRELN